MPTELDELERRIMQLEIERVSLAKETDEPSRERLERLERELADLKERSTAFKARWQREKEVIGRVRQDRRGASTRPGRPGRRRARAATSTARPRSASARSPSSRSSSRRRPPRLDELQGQGRLLKEEVDEEDIAEVVAKWTGIPVTRLLEGEVEKLVQMEDRLARRVVGQDGGGPRGLERGAARARRACPIRTGRSAPSCSSARPASARPSSRGRSPSSCSTTSARWSASTCPSTWRSTRWPRLVGAPPGYVGYDEGGQLTEAVRRRPYSVVLFDEIEKAHPDVWNVLLQVLDDGRLTDGQGRTVDFRNTVVIMTSNLGEPPFPRGRGPRQGARARARGAPRHLRPEFLNRIDEVIVFHSLGLDEIKQIVEIQLAHLRKRLAEKRIGLELTDGAKALLAKEGFDPAFGARPLKRTIQRRVQNPLALKLLEGEVQPGDTVRVDARGDELTFTKVVAAVAA